MGKVKIDRTAEEIFAFNRLAHVIYNKDNQLMQPLVILNQTLVILLLVLSPLLYGGTRIWAANLLHALLAVIALSFWMNPGNVRKLIKYLRMLAVPVCLVISVNLMGAWMWWNSSMVLDGATYHFVEIASSFPDMAGSVEKTLSEQSLMRVILLSLFFLSVVLIARERETFYLLLSTMAVSCACVAFLGICMRIFGRDIADYFWSRADQSFSFFATFKYHANAGAYMNMTFPFALIQCLNSFSSDNAHGKKAFWLSVMLMCSIGILLNTSKLSIVLAFVLLFFLSINWIWRRGLSVTSGLLVYLIPLPWIIFIIFSAGWVTSWDLWMRLFFEDQATLIARWEIYGICLKMLEPAGLMGFGPNTFQAVFPFFSHGSSQVVSGRWIHAHQDYLQTWIEWGAIGFVLWGTLFACGFYRGLKLYLNRSMWESSLDRSLMLGLLCSMAGVLVHGLVDFPLQVYSIQIGVTMMLGMLYGIKMR